MEYYSIDKRDRFIRTETQDVGCEGKSQYWELEDLEPSWLLFFFLIFKFINLLFF